MTAEVLAFALSSSLGESIFLKKTSFETKYKTIKINARAKKNTRFLKGRGATGDISRKGSSIILMFPIVLASITDSSSFLINSQK